jgi:hypothetical protein
MPVSSWTGIFVERRHRFVPEAVAAARRKQALPFAPGGAA